MGPGPFGAERDVHRGRQRTSGEDPDKKSHQRGQHRAEEWPESDRAQRRSPRSR